MKIPTENGYYKFYHAAIERKTIVEFYNDKFYMFNDPNVYTVDTLISDGDYFLEPVEPITFD